MTLNAVWIRVRVYLSQFGSTEVQRFTTLNCINPCLTQIDDICIFCMTFCQVSSVRTVFRSSPHCILRWFIGRQTISWIIPYQDLNKGCDWWLSRKGWKICTHKVANLKISEAMKHRQVIFFCQLIKGSKHPINEKVSQTMNTPAIPEDYSFGHPP